MSAAVILQSARLPFLLLPPACVALGAALVWASGQPVPVIPLILALLGAVLAHVAVNTLNEYQDFTSGLDLRTQRTPFSGGSGALPQHPEQRYWVLAAALVSLGLVILIGLYFIQRHGPAIAPLGLVGVLLILVYTRWINRRPWLCLVAPGLGFGLLMVAGTQFVLTGSYWWSAWLLGLIPFMLVNNLLLLNQYPDAEADAASGRYHFPIAYGFRASNRAYLLMWLAALALLLIYVAVGLLPRSALWAMVALLPGLAAGWGAYRHGQALAHHHHWLALNVATALITPVVLSVALLVGGQ
ncbi:MAG: prenyltransferase [Pseudomonadota bacterium]|nr:prenyltransferase [Pseudomonadales bacterium]MDY6922288.1 prenyltransferase [Pseudomonadota bacterium]